MMFSVPSRQSVPPFPRSPLLPIFTRIAELFYIHICISNGMNVLLGCTTNAWAHVLALDLTVSCVFTFFRVKKHDVKTVTALYNKEKKRGEKEGEKRGKNNIVWKGNRLLFSVLLWCIEYRLCVNRNTVICVYETRKVLFLMLTVILPYSYGCI